MLKDRDSVSTGFSTFLIAGKYENSNNSNSNELKETTATKIKTITQCTIENTCPLDKVAQMRWDAIFLSLDKENKSQIPLSSLVGFTRFPIRFISVRSRF